MAGKSRLLIEHLASAKESFSFGRTLGRSVGPLSVERLVSSSGVWSLEGFDNIFTSKKVHIFWDLKGLLSLKAFKYQKVGKEPGGEDVLKHLQGAKEHPALATPVPSISGRKEAQQGVSTPPRHPTDATEDVCF